MERGARGNVRICVDAKERDRQSLYCACYGETIMFRSETRHESHEEGTT